MEIQNLSAIGLDERYIISKSGKITDTKRNRICKPNTKHIFLLLDQKGKWQKIALKTVYKKVFGENYCIDNITTKDGEKWKSLSFDDRYQVSNYGRVKSRCGYEAKILKPYATPKGYLKVDIQDRGYYIHRLVYETFSGAAAETIHHLDYNKKNNSFSNLAGMDRKTHGKLTWEDMQKQKEAQQDETFCAV